MRCVQENIGLHHSWLLYQSLALACSTHNPRSKVARELMRGKPALESDVLAAIGTFFGIMGGQMHHYLDIARCSRKNLLHVCRGTKVSGLRQAVHPQPGVI